MGDKFCIIIDDEPQNAIINNLKADATRHGINLTCFQLNPSEDEYLKNVGDDNRPDYVIDIDKVIQKLKSAEYKRSKVDVIACDFNLDDEEVNGFQIIRKIRNHLLYKREIILYSANLETVIKKILSEDNLQEQINSIRNLTRANIKEFHDKNEYRQSILTLIRDDTFSLEAEIESLLHKHGEWTFKSVFPPLGGKTLLEVLEEIDKGTTDGKNFQRAILENAIAHMINLNAESNLKGDVESND